MNKSKNILILNTGGTFSKVYNPLTGSLDIDKTNYAIKDIINKAKIRNYTIDGILYKDSLEITKKDRKLLIKYIKNSPYSKIIIIHGTDTMHLTAMKLAKNIKNKTIILTGSMIPYSIENTEATANFMQGYGFLQNYTENNIYISMHGFVKKYSKIKKNYQKGIFEI